MHTGKKPVMPPFTFDSILHPLSIYADNNYNPKEHRYYGLLLGEATEQVCLMVAK